MLVAGARGMVGATIVRRLLTRRYTNVLGPRSAQLDLLDQTAVRLYLADTRMEYNFIAAAKVSGIQANTQYGGDFLYRNFQIEANQIYSAHLAGVQRFMFLASSAVYPRDSPQPIKQEYLLTGPLEQSNEPCQRAVHAEVFSRQQPTLVGHLHGGIEQLGDSALLDEPGAVLSEYRMVPDCVLRTQADETAERQVVLDWLDESPLSAHAVQQRQQHGPQELLGRDARTADLDVSRILGRARGILVGHHVFDPNANRAQRVVGRNEVLQLHRRKRALLMAFESSHRRLALRQSRVRCSIRCCSA
jgi:hypothetical protein